jgi:hypothetical protein
MPVTREQLNAMRRTLESDRQLYADSPEALGILDYDESLIADLEASWAKRNPNEAKLEVARQLVGQDIPTEENICETFKEIRKVEAAIASVSEELKGEPEFEQAQQAQGLLVEHFEALNTKRTIQDRVQALVRATSDLRLDLQAVGKLLNDNYKLSTEIAPVFEQIKTLAPALDIALDTPLRIPVKE